jgi:putative transposase
MSQVRKLKLANNEIYHVINRGIADLPIFLDIDDYYRCIFSLYGFNDDRPVEIRRERDQKKDLGGRQTSAETGKRDFFVEILAFSLMPNHIHLLLRQLKDDGISKFMKKVGTGYAKYFNGKYKKIGHLFQGKFRAVHIENDTQLKAIFVYIHTNPVSLVKPNWKKEKTKDSKNTIDFTENYKWSSYGDYIGKKNFPSLTTRKFLLEIMGGRMGCQEVVNDWVKNRKLITDENQSDIFLD